MRCVHDNMLGFVVYRQYFGGAHLPDDEKAERLKHCRHRARFAPPKTPEHFWSLEIPDTQQCHERGQSVRRLFVLTSLHKFD